MVADNLYEKALPVLQDEALDEEDKTDRLEELLKRRRTLRASRSKTLSSTVSGAIAMPAARPARLPAAIPLSVDRRQLPGRPIAPLHPSTTPRAWCILLRALE
ncbi:hypothetical protein P3342_001569 [Pyrenophora teres f. teres]|nr:hypothetical protein P3342_001569 [Pyrenophora teres f. teres]